MSRALWMALGGFVVCGAALVNATGVRGQDRPGLAPPAPVPAPTVNAPDNLRDRIDQLEKQIQLLIEANKTLQQKAATPPPAPVAPVAAPSEQGPGLSSGDVQKIVSDYLKTRDDKQKADEAAKKLEQEAQGFVVGKNVGLAGVWKNHQPWFETSDKAFRVHVGGRIQPDWIFGASADPAVRSGKGAAGPFQEGFNIRRGRLEADGWIYEVVDFFIEFDFVNQFATGAPASEANTFNAPAPTDVWAGINYIPVIGGIRIGNLKPAIGLDHLTSSRYLDFLERSHGFDIYYNRDNGFSPGFQIFNYTEDERISWQFTATKYNNGLFGWNIGGGEWNYCARITGLPYYEAEGRRMVHLGLGTRFSDQLDQGRANLNGRWLLRNGPPNLQDVVVQANVFGEQQWNVNPEFFMNLGPLSVQAEYIASRVTGVTSFISRTNPVATPVSRRSYDSQTAYVQALYFLTGEHRPYGRTALHGSGAAPTRVVPYRNYFFVKGDGSTSNPFSAGAWQVGARYSWADLNDNGINGGIAHEVTLGLNWFLNPNMKVQWNYDHGHRSIPGGTSDGYYYGFGMRMAFDF